MHTVSPGRTSNDTASSTTCKPKALLTSLNSMYGLGSATMQLNCIVDWKQASALLTREPRLSAGEVWGLVHIVEHFRSEASITEFVFAYDVNFDLIEQRVNFVLAHLKGTFGERSKTAAIHRAQRMQTFTGTRHYNHSILLNSASQQELDEHRRNERHINRQ